MGSAVILQTKLALGEGDAKIDDLRNHRISWRTVESEVVTFGWRGDSTGHIVVQF